MFRTLCVGVFVKCEAAICGHDSVDVLCPGEFLDIGRSCSVLVVIHLRLFSLRINFAHIYETDFFLAKTSNRHLCPFE